MNVMKQLPLIAIGVAKENKMEIFKVATLREEKGIHINLISIFITKLVTTMADAN